jgi:hypothetical protein
MRLFPSSPPPEAEPYERWIEEDPWLEEDLEGLW